MDFVKNWIVWIILGVIVLACLVVRLFVISSYISEEEDSTSKLLSLQDKVEKTVREIKRKNIPTTGDIMQAEERLKDIESEWGQTANKWAETSSWLDTPHGKDPEQEYAVFLLNRCSTLCDKLAVAREKHLGIYIPGSSHKPLDICDRKNHQLADLTIDYHSVEDTMKSWRQYLIMYKLHEACAKTKADVEMAYSPVENSEEDSDEPKFETKPQIRVVERFGEVTFGDVITAEQVNNPEESSSTSDYGGRRKRDNEKESPREKIYHDTYPVSFKVVAHIKVIQNLMQNILKAEDLGIVFVPKEVNITRFTDREIRSGMASSGNSTKISELSINEEGVLPINSELSYINEPPVLANLSYDVYHFKPFGEQKDDKNK